MKNILFALLFLLIPKLCISQLSENDEAVYLDSLYNISTAENYNYIRIIKDYKIPNKEEYQFSVYYKSGKIKTKGATSTRIGITKTGTFLHFYENGKRKSILNYKNDKPVGSYFEFYENGGNKMVGIYIDEEKNAGRYYKLMNLWDENGTEIIVNGEGVKTEENENFSEIVNYKNGYKDGLLQHINKKYNYTLTEKYENGSLISGERKTSDGEVFKYTELERKPLPKKGMEHFTNFIARNLKITLSPDTISNRIIVRFIIDKDGKIVEPEIINSLGNGIEKELIRIITSYGDWIPGEQRGEKIRCPFVLPIDIR